MSELKACPFCECTEIVAGKDYTRGDYRVDCLGCSAFITAPSLELAIQYWNTRPIEDKLQAEIDRLKAERKEFCPNCEAETPCTHEAELYVCDICGEDFAKYIVSRNCNVSDVSVTQDVLTDVKTPLSIEMQQAEAEIDRLQAERRWIPVSERLPEEDGQYLIIDRDGDMQVADRVISPYRSAWSFQADLWVSSQVTHWMPLPIPPEEERC